MKLKQLRKASHRRSAFSLVEVTIAIGIVAYAMVGLMGVFAVGIKSNHESKNSEAISQITALASSNYRSHLAAGGILPYTEYYTVSGALTRDPSERFYSVVVESAPSDGSVVENTPSNLHFITLSITDEVNSKPKVLRTAALIQ